MRWIALYLVLFISLVFAFQVIFPSITDEFVLVSADAAARPWTLVTSIFLHGDITHLLYNMLALGLFGSLLEHVIGEKKFLLIFFATGLASSFASTFLYSSVLGASGAIFGVIGALAIMRPRQIVWALGVPMPMIVAAMAWGVLDVLGLFTPSNIANLGHLGGLFAGIVIGLYLRKLHPEPKPRKKHRIVDDQTLDEWEHRFMRKR